MMRKKKNITVLKERIESTSFRNLLFLIFLFLILSLMESCRQVHLYHGKSVIISKTVDNSLNDSVMFFGKVYDVGNNNLPSIRARIWVDGLTIDALSDNTGSYSLKLPSGVYNVHCQAEFGSDEFTETRNDISLLPNEKIEIDFYLGTRVE